MTMQAKENLLRVIRHDWPQWVPNGMESVVTIGSPVVERPGQAGKDAFAVEWSFKPNTEGGTYPTPGGRSIANLSDWRSQITVPDLDTIDWTSVTTLADEVDRDACMVCGFVEMGLFERSYLLLGMEEALIAFLTQPEEMIELIAAIADYKIELIERFDDAVNMDMLWYGDDWGTQDNLFMPPNAWRRIIKPHTQRIYNCLKKRGIIINQHSCGKIEAVFPDIVQMGADIWHPCQPCNDLVGLKKVFAGKVSFCGGIDSQHVLDRPGVTTAQVRAEVRRCIDGLSAGGGYIAAPSHNVPYDKELLDAMNDEIAVYGRNVYLQQDIQGNSE